MYSLKKNFWARESSDNCGVNQIFVGISLCAGAFVPVLWRFPGHFLWLWVFVLDLWRWPGHISSAAVVSPGFAAIFGTFLPIWGIFSRFGGQNKDVLLPYKISSWNLGTFRDISPQMGYYLQVWRSKQGCFAATQDFVPEFGRFPGHFLSAARFVPEFRRFPGHFSPHEAFSPGLALKIRMFCCHTRKPSPNKIVMKQNKMPKTMKKKILPILIAIFWIAFFSYLTYLRLYAVVILSLILIMMSMAMSVSNEAES